jgi:hypothetical protein
MRTMTAGQPGELKPQCSLVYLECTCGGDQFWLAGIQLTATCTACGKQYPSRVEYRAFGLEEK